MSDVTGKKASLKVRLIHEAEELLMIFLYLALFFCTFTVYRRLLMRELGFSYFHYGFALLKALVFAKVIVLGRHARISRLLDDRPLIVPTLYKVLVFSVFALVFEVLEHSVGSMIQGHGVTGGFEEIIGVGRNELLARTLVVMFAFLPMFAFIEIGRVLGEGKLLELFLRRSTARAGATEP